jgi:hypothetical protein
MREINPYQNKKLNKLTKKLLQNKDKKVYKKSGKGNSQVRELGLFKKIEKFRNRKMRKLQKLNNHSRIRRLLLQSQNQLTQLQLISNTLMFNLS